MTTSSATPPQAQDILRRPRPTQAPVYHSGSEKLSEAGVRPWRIDDILDAVFFTVAAAAALWLAWVLLGSGWAVSPRLIVSVILFWAVLSYLALPRMHQVLTWLYVPDYFIGRTRTADGLLGDPVNLAAWGSEEDIHRAMTDAGWVRADPITLRSSWGIILSSVLRRSYPAAPVSDLMLFGRKQDFAYQKEVEGNPAQRHHIRFWHTPKNWVLPGGRTVDWLAGATYDRSVGFSSLTFQVTHKIDADIDIERNYVIDDVRWANPSAKLDIWPDFFTAYHDKNGGGDKIITDGNLYVLDVTDVVPDSPDSTGHEEFEEVKRQEEGARRQRPVELIGAILLLILLEITNIVRFFNNGELAAIAKELQASTDARTAQSVALIAAVVVTVVLMAVIAALAVATWFGHPRCRIALMVFLTLSITTTMTQVYAVGVRQASWGMMTAAALSVLALLLMSARACNEWERARKAERIAQRSGPTQAIEATAPET